MEDTEKKVIKIVGKAIILLFAAILIVFFMFVYQRIQTGTHIIEIAMAYIGGALVSNALIRALLAYRIYTANTAMQSDILLYVLLALFFVIFIMCFSLAIYLKYIEYERIRASALEPVVPDSALWKSKQICLFCGSEIPENTENCPRCGRARAQCSVCNEDIFSEDRPVKCPHCGALSHREHLAEWIREKGSCPKCGGKLKEIRIIGVAPKSKCLFCGFELPENAEFCPHCGEAIAKCSICQEDIISGDKYIKCPYCGVLSHRDHLLRWIKKKGYCPNCRQKLRETGIV
nr:zinc ribbon domain-containing protein [Candidatus Freyarchaeota archaeon]